MSRKLLMNNVVNGGGGELSPIMDGLICWLDAWDVPEGGIPDNWVDRTGNFNFYCPNKNAWNSQGANFKNGWFESTDKFGANFALISKEKMPSNIGTIHCFRRLTGYTNYGVMFGVSSGGQVQGDFKCCYRNNYCIGLYSTAFGAFNDGFNVNGKLPLNVNIVYKNDYLRVDEFSKTGTGNLFKAWNSFFALVQDNTQTLNVNPGLLGSFLMYNRELTEAEIQHNINYENSIQRG